MVNSVKSFSFAALMALPALAGLTAAANADVTISTHATAHMNCSGGLCSPTAANAVLNVNDLQTMLASSAVSVISTAQAPNIRVMAGFSWSSGNSLNIDSYRGIDIQKPISVLSTAPVSFRINDGGSGGTFNVGAHASIHFLSTFSTLTINGGSPYTLVNDISTLASDIASNPGGNYALAASYDAGPDGIYEFAPVATTFTGKFEGLGNTISNLVIRHGNRKLGLFATIDTGASAENISLTRMNLHATGNTRSFGGGLAAVNNGTIFNAHTAGKISTTGTGGTGGALVGVNNGTIANSSSNATPQNGTACVGGLVGINTGTISQSFAQGTAFAAQAGGLACENSGTIANSYELVSVGGRFTSPYPGGLVSVNDASGVLTTSYAAGQITAVEKFGGIAGTNDGSLSQVYWDTDDTGAGNTFGCGAGSCSGATPLTQLQLQSALPSGFDPAIWGQAPGVNNGYPYLLNNPPR